MFNLGFGEIAVILVILLIFVGPTRLPTLMKTTGKAMRTLRQASRDIQTSVGLDEMMREDILKPAPPKRVTAPRPAPGTQAQAEPETKPAALAQGAPDSGERTPAAPAVTTTTGSTDGPPTGGTA
jgi:sec-independent protein translocase protein TatB